MKILLPFVLLATAFIVNTEAGTFRCDGKQVRLDSQGVPSSGEGAAIKVPCQRVPDVKETI